MKSLYIVLALLVTVFACKQDNAPEVNPQENENKDWYILTAPEARDIKAVYGDIDGGLVITDGRKIYKTTDKGKTWQDAGYDSSIGLFNFAMKGDTLLALNTLNASSAYPNDLVAKSPFYYSLDLGSSWTKCPDSLWDEKTMVLMNRAKSGSGTEYLINRVESGGYVETTGIRTSSGGMITLPAKHQISSLYFDKKSRLYISGSAAICGTGTAFSYCVSPNGLLYVSRNPML